MKKTNVFLEVDDKVYNTVVEPHKRAKTFSRLIAALLKGYIEDEYVRAYGDEMVDDLRKASVDSLDSALSEMQESLANIGLFTDELQMVNNRGNSFFNKKTEDFRESARESEKYVKPVQEEERVREESESRRRAEEENNSLREEMDMLRTQMSQMYEQNVMIMELLNSGKITPKEDTAEERKEEVQEEAKEWVRFEEKTVESVKEDEELSVFRDFGEDEVAVTEESGVSEREITLPEIKEEVEEVEEEEQEEAAPMFDMGFLSDAAMSF